MRKISNVRFENSKRTRGQLKKYFVIARFLAVMGIVRARYRRAKRSGHNGGTALHVQRCGNGENN